MMLIFFDLRDYQTEYGLVRFINNILSTGQYFELGFCSVNYGSTYFEIWNLIKCEINFISRQPINYYFLRQNAEILILLAPDINNQMLR